MKKILLVLFCAALGLVAEIVKRPDADTLWLETGRNMKFGTKNYGGDWVKQNVEVTEAEDGFIVAPLENKKGSLGIAIPVSPKAPYLEFELEVLESKKNEAYLLFPWFVNIGPGYQQQQVIKDGYYVVNVIENFKYKKGTTAYMSLTIANAKIKVKNLRMTSAPKYKFDVQFRNHETGKPLRMSAVVELSFATKEEKLPEKLRVNYIDALEDRILEISGNNRVYLTPEKNNEGTLYANPEVTSLGWRNTHTAGTVMMIADGLKKPVITWLPYTWVQPSLKRTAQALPSSYDWIKDIRTEHPRIFINKDTIPVVKAWAKEIGCKQILLDADTFEIDETKTEKKRGNIGDKKPYKTQAVEVLVPYEPEAMTCAIAYILTGEQKYADKCFRILKHCLRAYQDCAEKRTAINWYGLKRITAMAAMDWIYNAIPEADRKQWIKEFVDVNLKYARHGWYGPFYGLNGGVGTTSGFYGDSNTELYMGVLAYQEGICDDLAIEMLKQGYDKYKNCMNYRDSVAEDDGILGTTAMGYSSGQYPWVSYDFLALWRTLFKKDVKLPKFNHLMYYGEWYQWNMLPGKGDVTIREFGLGDNAKTDMRMWSVSSHLYYIASLYHRDYPEEAAQVAASIKRMDGKFNVNCNKETAAPKTRKSAPKYYESFFRRLLAYGIKGLEPGELASSGKALARHFPIGGVLFMHGCEEKDKTYALFNVGSRLVAHKSRGDENHFSIFRKGYLAIDSGYRYDAWVLQCKYHHSSVAHNTMLIHDPDEVFENDISAIKNGLERFDYVWNKSPEVPGILEKVMPYIGDAQGSQDKNLGGRCRAFSTNDDYTYISGDATNVYSRKKCAEFNRQFVHLQPDVFVVFDRVESTKAEFKKEWLLHFLEEPVVKGNVTTAHVTDEGGTLRCTSLLPEGGVIEKIGGPGKEFWGGRANWMAPDKVIAPLKYGGKWRIALAPAKPAQRDYFLNVIEVGDAPLKNISHSETSSEVKLNLTLADGRKVELVFAKDGVPGGRISMDSRKGGKLEEPLTVKVQPQAGFLF